MQSAFEDYFVARNSYPLVESAMALGYGSAGCLTTDGFQSSCDAASEGVLARVIPAAPEAGLSGLSACGNAANAFCYLSTNSGASYLIQFELEHSISAAGLQKGLNCATPEGMKAGACSNE
jgi:hypothetical protein